MNFNTHAQQEEHTNIVQPIDQNGARVARVRNENAIATLSNVRIEVIKQK